MRTHKAKGRPDSRPSSRFAHRLNGEQDGGGLIEQEMRQLILRQIELLGENPNREGLRRTPQRVTEALKFMTRGYSQDPKTVLNDALFEATSDEMVIVKD